MGTHVPDARLLEALEGTGTGRAHIDACPECQARLAEARAGLALALAAEVPEPSPLYWKSLRRQLGRQVDLEGERRPAFWRRISLGPALAAAAVLAGIVTFLPVTARRPPAPTERPLPAWSALPPAEEDPGLDLLRAVAPAVADATPAVGCAGTADCVVDLSEEESQTLADRLRREIGAGRDL